MRAHAIWEQEDRRHGNDLAHWFRAEVEHPLRVTFDSNTYRQVLSSGPARDALRCELKRINEALRAGRMRGYLSETLITLEEIQKNDRVGVLGSTRLETEWRATGENTLTLNLVVHQNRKPLDPLFSEWVKVARELGMRFLRAGSRWFSDAGHIQDDGDTFFEPDESVLALAERMDRVNKVTDAIQLRGLGYARAVRLGLRFSSRDGKVDEWWLQGLARAKNPQEYRKVQLAVNEWADGDSIAAHIGYEIDLFCTKDKGTKAGGVSILNLKNQAWLEQTYGAKFVTLSELAAIVS